MWTKHEQPSIIHQSVLFGRTLILHTCGVLHMQCSLCEQNSSFANMYTAETYFTRGLEVNSHPLHLKKSDFASSRFLSLFYNT